MSSALAARVSGQSGARLKYAAYKASETPWLKQVPAQWELERLKYVATVSRDRLNEKPADLPYLGLENVESGTGRLLLQNPINEVDSVVGLFDKGDVLFGKLRPYLAKVVHADFRGVCTAELLIYRPNQDCDGKYLHYQMLSDWFIDVVSAMTYGAKMPRANAEQIGNLIVSVPPLPEQKVVAAYLDIETARIDALVAKKERLIALLEEKRAAMINQAVTRGLDPTTPLKDSGVPWLGQVSAHWEVTRLKHLILFLTSGSRGWSQYYSEVGPLFLRIGNLSYTAIDLDMADVQRVQPPLGAEGARTRVLHGDVLVSITAYIGAVGVVSTGVEEAYVNQHIALIRPDPKMIVSRLLGYFPSSSAAQEQLRLSMNGGTKDGLGLDDIRNVTICMPPLHEQHCIVAYVDQRASHIDALIAKVRIHIDRLREYRTALISAAVTGQIDVRAAAD